MHKPKGSHIVQLHNFNQSCKNQLVIEFTLDETTCNSHQSSSARAPIDLQSSLEVEPTGCFNMRSSPPSPHKQCKGREHDHCRTCDQGRTSFAGAIDTFIEGLHNVPTIALGECDRLGV